MSPALAGGLLSTRPLGKPIHIHTHTLSWTPFPCRSLQSTKERVLCYIGGFYPLPFINSTMYISIPASLGKHNFVFYIRVISVFIRRPSDSKESACNGGDPGSVPRSGRSPGEGNGNPLQYSCLENSKDRGAWRATQSTGLQRVRHDWVANTQEDFRELAWWFNKKTAFYETERVPFSDTESPGDLVLSSSAPRVMRLNSCCYKPPACMLSCFSHVWFFLWPHEL